MLRELHRKWHVVYHAARCTILSSVLKIQSISHALYRSYYQKSSSYRNVVLTRWYLLFPPNVKDAHPKRPGKSSPNVNTRNHWTNGQESSQACPWSWFVSWICSPKTSSLSTNAVKQYSDTRRATPRKNLGLKVIKFEQWKRPECLVSVDDF